MAPEAKSRLRRILKWTSVVVVLVALAGAGLYAVSWQFRKLVQGVANGHVTDFTLLGAEPETVVVSESPRLVADFYREPDATALILLLHGSAPRGRKHSLVRLLADNFRQQGFSVLALDLRGFGDSEDFTLPLEKDFRFEDAVAVAARRAVDECWAPQGKIVYVGHSLGAGVALRAARLDPRPRAVVGVGAPNTGDMFTRNDEAWRRKFVGQRFKDMEVPVDDVSRGRMEQYLREMDVVGQLQRGDLPPALIVYGEKENQARLVERLLALPPHGLHVVPDADHAYRSGEFAGVVFYNGEMLDSVVKTVADWVRLHTKELPVPTNGLSVRSQLPAFGTIGACALKEFGPLLHGPDLQQSLLRHFVVV